MKKGLGGKEVLYGIVKKLYRSFDRRQSIHPERFESEDYLQKVSTYLNHKIEECTSSDGYRKQSAEARSVLLALNIADDYFKAKKQGGALESDIEAKDKEMYDLKHELISVQIKYENAEKALDKLKAENQELQMKIVQLETEMKNHRTK